jgi:hypothetical protein
MITFWEDGVFWGAMILTMGATIFLLEYAF